MKLTTCLMILMIMSSVDGSILNWIWSKPTSEEKKITFSNNVPLASIPYEIMTNDEKFLHEASKITDIQISSVLDSCQHKVVLKIRKTCSALTEEELSKFSVNLLNCQSFAEGRKTYPCTDEMTLEQCTTDMDPDTWNAYHLMNNRARGICLSARNTQFRALTEITVNKLMESSQSQIKAFDTLKENQERLEMKTIEALMSLSEGNKILLDQQEHLKDAQASAHNLVASNLRELNNEKALIRAGHMQLSTMTEDIKKRLEKASQQLLSQTDESRENHKELLDDLMNIQKRAELIWDKIEASTERIVKQNFEAAAQFEKTLERLEKINGTIYYIGNVTESMKTEIDQKLEWIANYIGNTGEQFEKIHRICMHIVYLLAAMIVASFLNAPTLTRVTILGLIPMNLVAFLKHGMKTCLDFTSITVLILLITGMHFIMVGIQRLMSSGNPKTIDTPDGYDFPMGNGCSTPLLSSSAMRSGQKQTPLKRNFANEVYRMTINKLVRFKDNTVSIMQYAASWCRQNTSPVEELSCSYHPSKKSHDDVIYYSKKYPSTYNNNSEYETSRLYNDSENTLDANDLRRRLISTRSSSVRSNTSSRSVTPSSGIERTMCSAITKNGTQCRSRAQIGREFCGRHTDQSSVSMNLTEN
ncbi:protein brambleberry-like [Aphidius gifuensis]|nr:protein brambleberry-like [Aphidius gifuensis]